MNGEVKFRGIPPIRQRADEWMGHGAFVEFSFSGSVLRDFSSFRFFEEVIMASSRYLLLTGAAAILLAIPAFTAFGQNPGQSLTTADAPAGGQSITTLHANARLVLLDVVVTERGAAVHSLERQRFHVFEDGREQPLAFFEEHSGAEPHSAAARPAMIPATLPQHTFTNLPLTGESTAANILLLDGLNTPLSSQMNVRHNMLEYASTIQPGAPMAIFTLSTQLRMLQGFTSDPAMLASALKASGGGQQSVILDGQSGSILPPLSALIGSDSRTSSQIAAATMRQFEADNGTFQMDTRVHTTLDAMRQLARFLSAIPGRKNLIWFSGSFPIVIGDNVALDDAGSALRDFTSELRETGELLSESRVAVYPVDAGGLMLSPSFGVADGTTALIAKNTDASAGTSRGMAGVDATFRNRTFQNHVSMTQLAEATGGKEYFNTNGFKEAVADAVDNGASYYTLAYVPRSEMNGHFRRFKVRIDNASFKLEYRAGYFDDPVDKPSAHRPGETSLIDAITAHGAPAATQIVFLARVLDSGDAQLAGMKLPEGPAGVLAAKLKSPIRRAIVDLHVDTGGLSFSSTADGARQGKIETTLVAYDRDGNRINFLDQALELTLKPEVYARTQSSGIPLRLALDLPRDPVYLRIALRDINSGHTGSLEVPVLVEGR
jgi:VWFA-related protein